MNKNKHTNKNKLTNKNKHMNNEDKGFWMHNPFAGDPSIIGNMDDIGSRACEATDRV